MPNQHAAHSEDLSPVFHALADPTRRAVLSRLSLGPAQVSELAKPFSMALPSFTQHLGVLEASGLVRSHKQGRIRTFELNPVRVQQAEGWLSEQRRLWEGRFDRLDAFLKSQS